MKLSQEKILELLRKYRADDASDEEMLLIESLLENGTINFDDIDGIRLIERKIELLETPAPTMALDNRFYQMLGDQMRAQKKPAFAEWFSFDVLLPRLAFASVTFFVGLAIGYFVWNRSVESPGEIQALSNEVKDLKEMMMLSLLEKESATDRLKAVSLSQELSESSETVTKALLKTLNSDENINVRLAALEALKPYCSDSKVRTALIQSIGKQDSPLIQIALAELMGALQEKGSLSEFEKILKNRKTPPEVKNQIKKNIQVLI